MSSERIKGNVAFFCDLTGCLESLETGARDFRNAADDMKAEGWKIRKRDGDWVHFCCEAHEEMDFRGQSLVSEKAKP